MLDRKFRRAFQKSAVGPLKSLGSGVPVLGGPATSSARCRFHCIRFKIAAGWHFFGRHSYHFFLNSMIASRNEVFVPFFLTLLGHLGGDLAEVS